MIDAISFTVTLIGLFWLSYGAMDLAALIIAKRVK